MHEKTVERLIQNYEKAKSHRLHFEDDYDEILLIGSGKGVTSVKNIKQIGWKRKKLDQYKIFSKYYNLAINKSNPYKF